MFGSCNNSFFTKNGCTDKLANICRPSTVPSPANASYSTRCTASPIMWYLYLWANILWLFHKQHIGLSERVPEDLCLIFGSVLTLRTFETPTGPLWFTPQPRPSLHICAAQGPRRGMLATQHATRGVQRAGNNANGLLTHSAYEQTRGADARWRKTAIFDR